MTLFIILLVVLAALVVYVFRVPILAKLLGQSPDRVRRTIGRGKR